MVKKFASVVVVAALLLVGFAAICSGEAAIPEKKQTTLGLYITAKDAYLKWLSDPGNVRILDCRTPEEYTFIGHAPMAYNIPSKFNTHQFDAEKKHYSMQENPDFISLAKSRFALTDTILIMCRSGARSAASVNKLVEAGFAHVYNITDGFEGDKVSDPESYYDGQRFKNGWRNAGNPWTYQLDPVLVFATESKAP